MCVLAPCIWYEPTLEQPLPGVGNRRLATQNDGCTALSNWSPWPPFSNTWKARPWMATGTSRHHLISESTLLVVMVRNDFTEMSLHPVLGFEIFCPVTLRIDILWTYLMVVLVRRDFTEMTPQPDFGFENFVGEKYERSEEAAAVSLAVSLCSYI